MDFKLLLMKKGLRQIEVAKKIGANHVLVNLQINKHRILPVKYHDKFCSLLEITKEDLLKAMNEEGGNNE